jgi:AraC-like DNA-binding protein/mannose-6-phosphate isomerase-like protein (cupin superfamily)
MFKTYHIGHFINQPQSSIPFAITRFENMSEPDVDDFHKHTFYEILWIEEGCTKQFIDYQEYEIKANSLFFISPNQLHYFETWQELKGVSLMFTEDFFLINQQNKNLLFELSFLDNFYSNPFLLLNEQNSREIKPIFQQLINEKSRKDCSEIIIQALLIVLLSMIQRIVNEDIKKNINRKYLLIFKKFNGLLEDNFKNNLSASEYANKLNITNHHLNLIVKEITGKTLSEVIKARKVLEAKRLLTFSHQNISEIGYFLGFEEKSYFSRIFKQETGQTPQDFKKKMSQKYHI